MEWQLHTKKDLKLEIHKVFTENKKISVNFFKID